MFLFCEAVVDNAASILNFDFTDDQHPPPQSYHVVSEFLIDFGQTVLIDSNRHAPNHAKVFLDFAFFSSFEKVLKVLDFILE